MATEYQCETEVHMIKINAIQLLYALDIIATGRGIW